MDVMPFVPVKDATNEECIELSNIVGKRLAEEADLPVFLYEMSARKEGRRNLAAIRKGQFEGMAEKVKDPEWEPDFGGARINPTGGVCAVGARPPSGGLQPESEHFRRTDSQEYSQDHKRKKTGVLPMSKLWDLCWKTEI